MPEGGVSIGEGGRKGDAVVNGISRRQDADGTVMLTIFK